jgi:hypothetical protein
LMIMFIASPKKDILLNMHLNVDLNANTVQNQNAKSQYAINAININPKNITVMAPLIAWDQEDMTDQ